LAVTGLLHREYCAEWCRVLQLISAPRSAFTGAVPPHFYGQLIKTPEGRALLHEKGHFADFAAFIRENGLEDDNPARIAQLKSVLWAVVRGSMTSSAHPDAAVHRVT
jgi:hypothetical protein